MRATIFHPWPHDYKSHPSSRYKHMYFDIPVYISVAYLSQVLVEPHGRREFPTTFSTHIYHAMLLEVLLQMITSRGREVAQVALVDVGQAADVMDKEMPISVNFLLELAQADVTLVEYRRSLVVFTLEKY